MLPRIAEHFTVEGALGVVVVDASRLAVIEQQYGAEAHQPLAGLRSRLGPRRALLLSEEELLLVSPARCLTANYQT